MMYGHLFGSKEVNLTYKYLSLGLEKTLINLYVWFWLGYEPFMSCFR